MEKITVDTWRRLLGYDPGPEMKRMILQSVAEEKICLAEACSRYAFPPVLMGDEECKDYDNPYRPPIRYVVRKHDEK
jgi:hypothetical protein